MIAQQLNNHYTFLLFMVAKNKNKISKVKSRRDTATLRRQKPFHDKDFSGLDQVIQNNKIYIGRFENGKLKEKRLKTKDFNLADAKRKFNDDNTLKKDLVIQKLTNVKEKTSWGKYKPSRSEYQYVVEITGKGLSPITARSMRHRSDYPKEQARVEAWDSAFERLSQSEGGTYDAEKGMQIFFKKKLNVREGYVWYVKN